MNAEIEASLIEDNPWWQGKDFRNQLGIARPRYTAQIFKAFSIREIKVLSGVRRCGKSTLLYQLIQGLLEKGISPKNIALIKFENNLFSPWIEKPQFLDRLFETVKTLNNPKGEIFLFLDEVQEVPGWEKWVNKIFERKLPVQMVVTGSSSTLGSKVLATLLTGRNLTFEIMPLDFQEFLFFKTGIAHEKKPYREMLDQKTEYSHYFEKYLQEGGFPGVVLTQDETLKDSLLKQYFQDILYRDLIRKRNIRNTVKLERLAFFLISNVGRTLSYRKIEATQALAVDTLKEYFTYFEEACLFSYLSPFTFSTKARLNEAHHRKIYTADHGLRRAVTLNVTADLGFVVENLVFQKIREEKIIGYLEEPEIDFVYQRGGGHFIQVCYTDELPPREIENLQAAQLKSKSKTIVSKNTWQTLDSIQIVPAWYYLL